MKNLWISVPTGVESIGPALPADLSDLQNWTRALETMDQGLIRMRWDGCRRVLEFTCNSKGAYEAVRKWLIGQGTHLEECTGLSFRNLRSGEAWDTRANQIIHPEPPAPKHQQHLTRKANHSYHIRDLCDAGTPEELHLAAYWYAMHRFGVHREPSKTLFLGNPHAEITTSHLRWTARRLESGKLVWMGSAYLITGLSMAEAIAFGQSLGETVLYAKAKTWRGSVLPCSGASDTIDLEDALAVSRNLGNAYFDITGSGSSILEMCIHSYGWNRIPGFSRAWEDAPGGFVLKGRRYGFK